MAAFEAAPSYADLLQPLPGLADLDPYEALAQGIGLPVPQPPQAGYAGIRELARDLGLA